MNEADIQISLRHENVVEVYEVVDSTDHLGLVMEFIDGPTLSQVLSQRKLTFEEIDNLGQGILRGVRAAHRHNTIHRDLKPSNILLQRTEKGLVPKVSDFGLAKIARRGSPGGNSITKSGQVMGSPPFMSPEQIRDSKTVDARTDVFSLGAVLYRMCTGQRPFNADDVIELFVSISTGVYTPPRDLVPDIPDRMLQAIEGSLVVERDERIQNVDHLLAVWLDRPIAPSAMKTVKHPTQERPVPPEVVRDLDKVGAGQLISVESMEQGPLPRTPQVPGKAWLFGLTLIAIGVGTAVVALALFIYFL